MQTLRLLCKTTKKNWFSAKHHKISLYFEVDRMTNWRFKKNSCCDLPVTDWQFLFTASSLKKILIFNVSMIWDLRIFKLLQILQYIDYWIPSQLLYTTSTKIYYNKIIYSLLQKNIVSLTNNFILYFWITLYL